MGSLSVNIAKVKRFSPGGLKVRPQENREPDLHQRETIRGPELPFTDTERTFTRMVDKEPLLETIVTTFDLATPETGERPRMVKEVEQIRESRETQPDTPPRDRNNRPGRTLREIALSILEPQNNYSREAIVEKIRESTGVSQERAENGFNKILEAGELEEVPGQERYYLKGYDPF